MTSASVGVVNVQVRERGEPGVNERDGRRAGADFHRLDRLDRAGAKNFRETVDRYEASRARFEELGVRLAQVYWTLGEHDIIAVAEADDERAMPVATLMLGSQGNVRTTTMRAVTLRIAGAAAGARSARRG